MNRPFALASALKGTSAGAENGRSISIRSLRSHDQAAISRMDL